MARYASTTTAPVMAPPSAAVAPARLATRKPMSATVMTTGSVLYALVRWRGQQPAAFASCGVVGL